MADFEEKKRQKENLAQLDEEAAGREARIRNRRQQDEIDAKRKFRKRLKMMSIWIGLLIIGLFALTWFSKDFVNWLHKLIN